MKNLIFAPCDKVIIDKNGNPSLISILQNVNVQVPEGQSIPENAVAPKEWYVFTHWLMTPDELGKTFTQRGEIIMGDGKPFGDPPAQLIATFKFEDPEKNIAQNTITILGFPIGKAGPLTLRVWMEESGNKISDILEYPLKVVYPEIKAAT